MQSIERYGVIALLFLVVTVVAVVLWEGEAEAADPDHTVAQAAARSFDTPSVPSYNQSRPAGDSYVSLVTRNRPLERGSIQPSDRGGHAGSSGQTRETPRRPSDEIMVAELPIESEATTPADERRSADPEPDVVQPARPIEKANRGARASLYTVKSGDTLGEISLAQLGTSKRWQEIVDLNPGLDPARLKVGARLKMPRKSTDASRASEVADAPVKKATKKTTAAAGTCKVREGDSLWRIAARTLGDGERWREIADLNPKIDPNRLVVGQVLHLPEGADATATVSEGPRVAARTETSGRKSTAKTGRVR